MRSKRLGGWITAAVIAFLGLGCATPQGTLLKSGRTNYAAGNYDQAVGELARSLRIQPDFKEAQELLREVSAKAVEAHLDRINEAKASAGKFKWDRVAAEYTALAGISQAIKSLPSMTDPQSKTPVRLVAQDYTQAAAEARSNAAEEHYQEGKRLFGKPGMSSRDAAAEQFRLASSFVPGYKDAAALTAEGYYQEGVLLSKQSNVDVQKQAAKAFAAAQQAVPGYKDASTAYDKARKAGVKRIAIIPFEDRSGKNGSYGDVGGTIVDGVISRVMGDPTAMEFLEIVSRDQLERVIAEQRLGTTGMFDEKTVTKLGQLLGVHEILTGQITQVIVTPERTTTTVIEQKGQVCERRQRVVDSKGKASDVCIWDPVSAYVTMYNRKANVSIAGSYKVIDVKTAKLKETQQLSGRYDFSAEWATFRGDERALDGEPKRLASLREVPAPVNEEMVSRAATDLLSKLAQSLKSYAR